MFWTLVSALVSAAAILVLLSWRTKDRLLAIVMFAIVSVSTLLIVIAGGRHAGLHVSSEPRPAAQAVSTTSESR